MDKVFAKITEALCNDEDNKIVELLNSFGDMAIAEFFRSTNDEARDRFIKNYLQYYPGAIPEIDDSFLICEIVQKVGEKKFASMIRSLSVDEIVDVLQMLSDKEIASVLSFLPEDNNKTVLKQILSYPEDSAGRLIHKDFIVIPENWSVEQTLQLVRSHKQLPKDFSEIFVIDDDYKPVGIINLSDLLRFKHRSVIGEIMRSDIQSVDTGTDQEDVAHLFRDYGLSSVAVVDSDGRIVGVITTDDVVDVISREAEEDILYVGKVSESDLRAGIFDTMLGRLKWLIITFLSINFSSYIIGFFSDVLNDKVELAILMPIIAAMGGNAGVQASTVSLRAIITKQLDDVSAIRLLRKEFLVGFFNGLIMSLLMILVIYFRFHDVRLELTFLFAVIIVFSIATSVGSAIPILIEKFGGDSALSSSIITSSFTDIFAFFVLLSVATLMLS